MHYSPRKYSVFLTPAGTDRELCQALIENYGLMFRVTPFEPHVTIYSGEFSHSEPLQEAVRAAVHGTGPVLLRVRGVACSEAFFKTLYIEFHEDQTLREIHRRIGELLPAPSGYQLAPHLSLLYRDMPLSEKRSLAQGLHLDRDFMTFDRVSIATPGNVVEGWRDTARWETVWSMSLREGR